MVFVKSLVLDVLKPLHPNALDFAMAIADTNPGLDVKVSVSEVDAQTETIVLTIRGADIEYDNVIASISAQGASIHSVDEVEVQSSLLPESKR